MRCPMDGSFHLSLIGSACGGGSDWSSQLGNADLNASGVSVGSDGYSDLGSSIFSTLPDGALYFCPQSESVATCHVSPSLAQPRLDIRHATSPVSIISRIRFVSFAAQRDSLMARRYLPDYGGLSASIVSLDSVNPAREEFDRLMENRRMRSGLKVLFCVWSFSCCTHAAVGRVRSPSACTLKPPRWRETDQRCCALCRICRARSKASRPSIGRFAPSFSH